MANTAALSGAMACAVQERWRLVRASRKLRREGVRGCCGWPSSSSEGGEEEEQAVLADGDAAAAGRGGGGWWSRRGPKMRRSL
jgi:hypothetical protein